MLSFAHGLWVYPVVVAVVVTVIFMFMDRDGKRRNERAARDLARIDRERDR